MGWNIIFEASYIYIKDGDYNLMSARMKISRSACNTFRPHWEKVKAAFLGTVAHILIPTMVLV